MTASPKLLTADEVCEQLRQRAVRILERAISELRVHPENPRGMMNASVAVERIRRAAATAKRLEALAAAGDAL